MNTNIIDIFIKSIILSISISYTFFKLFNIKIDSGKQKVIVLIITLLLGILDYCLKELLGTYSILINIIIQIVIYSFIRKIDLFYTSVGVIIANAITYIVMIFATVIVYVLHSIIKIGYDTFYVGLNFLIQLGILILLFKTRKLKDGLYFLNKNTNDEYLSIIIANICAVIILIYCLLVTYFVTYNNNTEKLIYISFAIVSIFMIIIIQKTLTMSYKHKMLEMTLKDYESKIKEKDQKIQKVESEKEYISKLNHEFDNRQKALELKIENALSSMKYESGMENDLKDKIKELSKEYAYKAKENQKENYLPKTNIEEIDDMFLYMSNECLKNGIEFILKINGNINHLVNNYIDEKRLVTLIGDHLKDAIIAVNCSTNEYKGILAILGIKDDTYEFCVYDSGIEFEIETFDKLGLERITTHKDNGGSGIGFITTFETLKETKASFIIEELKDNNYTKAVKFIWDNKSRLEIKSYRADEIIKNMKSDRFKVEK